VDDPASLAELFRRHGLKVTPQRQCIFQILHANPTHPTAEAIYAAARARMPTISLKTVYETLHGLAALDQIHQLDLGTGSSRFDPLVHPHHHLVCTSCGRVENVDIDLDAMSLTAAQRQGFVIRHAEIILHGVCPECRARNGGEKDPDG
jgi:Fur family peroxide stress response transcriptional regulator